MVWQHSCHGHIIDGCEFIVRMDVSGSTGRLHVFEEQHRVVVDVCSPTTL